MRKGLNLREISTIYIICGVSTLVAVSQYFYFPNFAKNFDPNIFIYLFGGMGVLSIFLLRRKEHLSKKKIFSYALFIRGFFILIQVILYVWGGIHNISSEVNYYAEVIGRVLDGYPVIGYTSFGPGFPPGYQFWIYVNYSIYMKYMEGFWRELVLSIMNVVIDLGIIFFTFKIGESKGIEKYIHVNKEQLEKNLHVGLFIYATSIIPVYYYNVRIFIDPFPILLGIIGIWLFFQKKYIFSAIMLSVSTLIKFISIFWIIIILFHFLRKRDVKSISKYLITSAAVALGSFMISATVFGMPLITYFFEFLEQFHAWSAYAGSGLQLNQSYWLLVYEPSFFAITIPIIMACGFILVYKGKKGLTLNSFSTIAALYLLFQPWYDQRYFLWIMPLMCVDLVGSLKNFQISRVLIYTSMYIFLFFRHFVLDMVVNTLITDDPLNVGLIYRICGQSLSYIAMTFVIWLEFRFQFRLRAPKIRVEREPLQENDARQSE
ncbi:MAG: hypothetical protein ACTSUE_25185 [Promethearchaeota archaeon]